MTALTIRTASPEDVPLLLQFIKELAVYERAEHAVSATLEDLHASLFSDSANAHALICMGDGVAIGFAVYFFNYSTWLGKKGLYLEDLYVSPEHRKCGAGKLLLQPLASLAVSQGCERLEWSVLDWNEPAIQFYKSLGAEPMHEWLPHRLSGEALRALAKNGDVSSQDGTLN
jgi:GNAT superfamily N-acetyltransferase